MVMKKGSVMKVLALNVMRDDALDFQCISQAFDGPKGAGLKPDHLAVLLVPVDADNEHVATALEEIADDIRELGVRQLYKAADVPAMDKPAA